MSARSVIAITPADIKGFRSAARDHAETESLKARLVELRASRDPFFLGFSELDPIFKWKLVGQYGRNRDQRERNTEADYRTITQATFATVRQDAAEEAARRLRILMCLEGVGIAVASAILALIEPGRYCVIDFRGWRAMYGQEKRNFGINDYVHYRSDVEKLAQTLGWCVQETDLALWAYDDRMFAKGG